LLPPPQSTARYLVQNSLNWVASELHASFGPLFAPSLAPEVAAFCKARCETKLAALNDLLLQGGKRFLVGASFTVADSYCYIVCSWCQYVGIDLGKYANAKAYFDGIAALPAVKAAHARMAQQPDMVC
jgi:glutathione S-transferase